MINSQDNARRNVGRCSGDRVLHSSSVVAGDMLIVGKALSESELWSR
jgi:hypothetical protein